MRTSKIIAALFVATAAVGVSACGSDDTQNDATGQTQVQQEQQATGAEETEDAEARPKPAEELKKDVTVVECKSGAGPGLSATIEVTNSLDEPMEYLGTISFLDAGGTQLADGIFNTGTLQPGEKSTEEVPAANVYDVVQGATCQVAEVKLDEPV